MRQQLNICNIYIFLWCLYSLQGTLYTSGGIISQGILAILLTVSLYYLFVVNFTMRTPSAIKALNVFIVMLTVYGLLYAASGKIIIVQHTGLPIGVVGYLKNIYISLLPIYAFYAFTDKGLLIEVNIRRWFFIFLVIVTVSYFKAEREALQVAMMKGSMQEEFTNNTGYRFLSLMLPPFFFSMNRMVQYLALAYIMAFIIMGMKRGAMIIDISCDRAGGIETSIPTTIENPTYQVDGITHYVCDHTPSLFFKTTTEALSEIVAHYCDSLITETPNKELQEAKIMDGGVIIDQRINKFQNR